MMVQLRRSALAYVCMMSKVKVKVKRNTLTQFGNSYLSPTMFYVCLIGMYIYYATAVSYNM